MTCFWHCVSFPVPNHHSSENNPELLFPTLPHLACLAWINLIVPIPYEHWCFGTIFFNCLHSLDNVGHPETLAGGARQKFPCRVLKTICIGTPLVLQHPHPMTVQCIQNCSDAHMDDALHEIRRQLQLIDGKQLTGR